MTHLHRGTRYSRWDGTQRVDALDATDLMNAIAEELLRDGDLLSALRRMFWEGVDREDGQRNPGLREMMNQLRRKRQEQLQQYDLGSILEHIRQQLREVLETERKGIDQRIEAARQQSAENGETLPGEAGEGDQQAMQEMLEQIANRRKEQLDALPGDTAGAIKGLQQYDFMDPEARQKYQDLVQMLQQQVLQQSFEGLQQSLNEMTPEQVAEMAAMMADLNTMLEAHAAGQDPGFEQFMHKWGHYFGPGIDTIEDLLEQLMRQQAAMQQLMQSMSEEQRGQLQGMMQAVMQQPALQDQMSRLQSNLGQVMDPSEWRRNYQFSGDESLTLSEAMHLMDRLDDYDHLEQDLKNVRDWNDFANLDEDKMRDLLGEELTDQMQQLSEMTKMLEEAGYVRKAGRGYELTPHGARKIGEKALSDIFIQLKRDRSGQHELNRAGGPGERVDVSKPYEFGDAFLLDLPATVMNAVRRQGASSPVQLAASDFEVYRTESVTRSSTVLMIDMSRSMFYSDSFIAAKRIALALDSLIRSKYPNDTLHILGFSYMAEELKPTDLATLTWNEYQYGTNMQHGFQLARKILGREKGSNRQIIMITDGEPTAHLENGQVIFNWPPMPATFKETLREVIRCTRDDITINTFMLERSPYMVQFVNDLMKINNGRVFASTPERLGEYILIDYENNKRKWIG